MPEMHLRQPGFTCSAVDHLLKTKQEYKNLNKHEIHDIFIKTNYSKRTYFQYDMAYEDLRIYLEEQLLINYYVIKDLILLKI